MRPMHLIDRAEEIVSSLCLGGMAIIIGMQVFNRYVMEESLVWSEELGRYLFIWAVYVGCSFVAKEDRHLEVTIARNFSGPKVKKVIVAVAQILTFVFCALCVVWGIKMVFFLSNTGQQTPALEVSIYWVYLAVPVGMALMGLRTLQKLWRLYAYGEIPSEHLPEEGL